MSNLNPVGAVDKKGKDKYCIIQDARLANLGVDDWGIRLFSVMELINMPDWCSIMYGDDISVMGMGCDRHGGGVGQDVRGVGWCGHGACC